MKAHSSPLISAADLAARLEDPILIVLDCRHDLQDPEAGLQKFTAGHIPGARHAHLDRDLARSPDPRDGRHPLPTAERFAAVLGRLGVSNESFVVVYDDCGGTMAARLWWMLRWLGHTRVAVLDGGIQAWAAAQGSLEQGPPQSNTVIDYDLRDSRDEWIVTTEELADLLARNEIILLDARARQRFDGLTEPIDPVAGHIPGAVNLPFSELLAEDGTFRDPATLAQRFTEALGGQPPGAAVTMCGSGVTACHLQLGMEIAGLGLSRLYVGSWSEWIRDPDRPVATR